jgi:ADP-ribose pyrophosphatase
MSGPGGKPESVYRGRFLELKRRGAWEYVERTGSTGVVAVLALTDDGAILLTEQFRPPVDARVIEVPAGLAGDIDGQEQEPLEAAARRELLEEAGYEAGDMQPLVAGPTSSGLTSEIISIFLARSLRRVSEGGGDHTEDITVHEVPLAEAREFLLARMTEGVLVDPKVWAALYFAEHLG